MPDNPPSWVIHVFISAMRLSIRTENSQAQCRFSSRSSGSGAITPRLFLTNFWQVDNLGTYGMIRAEIAQLSKITGSLGTGGSRTVLASYNKSINGGGNIAWSFQTHPHVIFSMLTCRNKRKRLPNHWWYPNYMGTYGKLMKSWKNWKMYCMVLY